MWSVQLLYAPNLGASEQSGRGVDGSDLLVSNNNHLFLNISTTYQEDKRSLSDQIIWLGERNRTRRVLGSATD